MIGGPSRAAKVDRQCGARRLENSGRRDCGALLRQASALERSHGSAGSVCPGECSEFLSCLCRRRAGTEPSRTQGNGIRPRGPRRDFLAFVNQSQLPSVYCASDLFVLPSLFEPFGLVVNEAMLCGLPVAVSDRVGAKFDLVRPDENGYRISRRRCGSIGRDPPADLAGCGKEGAHGRGGAAPHGNVVATGVYRRRRASSPTGETK